MTIVKPSSKPPRRSSIDLSLKKTKKFPTNAGIVDVFSNSHLPGLSKSSVTKVNNNDDCNNSDNNCSFSNESISEEEEEQAPKEDLQDLFAAIQNRLKKKTIDEKKAMESELKKTINRTVQEMNQKIEVTKNQIDLKLNNMKYELDLVQRDHESQLVTIKQEYEKFQKIVQKSIEKIDLGERKIYEIRENFLSEIMAFNRDFEFPKDKIEDLFNLAIKKRRDSDKY